MEKEILIEIFKSKLCEDGELKRYGNSYAIDFGYHGDLVDVRIFSVETRIFPNEKKYFIRYETITSEIEQSEYNQLFELYIKKENEIKKIEEEKERQLNIKHMNSILEMYKTISSKKREVLIEKNK